MGEVLRSAWSCGSPHCTAHGHRPGGVWCKVGWGAGDHRRVRESNASPDPAPPPGIPKLIPGTISYIALETSENVVAAGNSTERSRNVSESESESAGFPTENRWYVQTRTSCGGTVYGGVGGGRTCRAVGRGPTTPCAKGGRRGTLTRAWRGKASC